MAYPEWDSQHGTCQGKHFWVQFNHITGAQLKVMAPSRNLGGKIMKVVVEAFDKEN